MQDQPLYNWRVLPLTRGDQQKHIDQSEQMLSTASPGNPPTLFWSQAESEGLVLGFSQKHDVVNPHALTELALPIYHRRAGGTAVLVGPHLLSLDVMLPAGHPLALSDLVESYRWLGETWSEALRSLGVPATLTSVQEARGDARDTSEALAMVSSGAYDAAFIMRATPVEQVQAVAAAGENMPPKSTYFFPKLLTGLLINPLF